MKVVEGDSNAEGPMTRVSAEGILHHLKLTEEIPWLPGDVWAVILRNLLTKDLVSKIALVSREWKDMVNSLTQGCFIFTPSCWSRPGPRPFQTTSKEMEEMYISNLEASISYRKCLTVLVINPDVKISLPHIQSLFAMISDLAHLRVLEVRCHLDFRGHYTPDLKAWHNTKKALPKTLQVLKTDVSLLGKHQAGTLQNMLYIEDAPRQRSRLDDVFLAYGEAFNVTTLCLTHLFKYQILYITAQQWRQLHNLKTLELQFHEEHEFSFARSMVRAFHGLEKLKVLRLRGMRVEVREISEFGGLLRLKELDLSLPIVCIGRLQRLLALPNIERLLLHTKSFTHMWPAESIADLSTEATSNLHFIKITCRGFLQLANFADIMCLPNLKTLIIDATYILVDLKSRDLQRLKSEITDCTVQLSSSKGFNYCDSSDLESIGFVRMYDCERGFEMLLLSPNSKLVKFNSCLAEQDLYLAPGSDCNSQHEILSYLRYLQDVHERSCKEEDDLIKNQRWSNS